MSETPAPVNWMRDLVRRTLRMFESERQDGEPWRTRFDVEVKLEPDELDGGWVAEVVNTPGVLSQGETESEALANIGDAIAAVVSARFEEEALGLSNDHPRSTAHQHRVQVAL